MFIVDVCELKAQLTYSIELAMVILILFLFGKLGYWPQTGIII